MNYKVPHYSLRLVKEKTLAYASSTADGPASAEAVLYKLIGARDTEYVVVLMLDGRNAIVGSTVVAIGGMHGASLRPRDLFKAAILANAAAVIVSHNHPSGDPTPSKEDREFTARAVEAGLVLGIPIVDHVIVTKEAGRSFSFQSKGMI